MIQDNIINKNQNANLSITEKSNQITNLSSCNEDGKTELINDICYMCTNKLNRFIAVNKKICDGEKIESPQELLLNALNEDDKFQLRRIAYKNTRNDPNASFGLKAATTVLEIGDYVGYGWGKITASISKLLGKSDAQPQNSVADYYIAQMQANQQAKSKIKITIGQALATAITGGLETVIFGLTSPLTEKVATKVFQGDKNEIKVALSAKSAGLDLTNTIALVVPFTKGAGTVGSLTSKTGEKIIEKPGEKAISKGVETTIKKNR